MRALAITGMDTALMIPSIMSGSLIREMPPSARMSAGTRSRAITATAPASSAIFACSGVTTSMITPPLSISAMPRLTRAVPVSGAALSGAGLEVDTGFPHMEVRQVLSMLLPARGAAHPPLCQRPAARAYRVAGVTRDPARALGDVGLAVVDEHHPDLSRRERHRLAVGRGERRPLLLRRPGPLGPVGLPVAQDEGAAGPGGVDQRRVAAEEVAELRARRPGVLDDDRLAAQPPALRGAVGQPVEAGQPALLLLR